jgi:hypothetical protein
LKNHNAALPNLLGEVLFAVTVKSALDLIAKDICHAHLITVPHHLNMKHLEDDLGNLLKLEIASLDGLNVA